MTLLGEDKANARRIAESDIAILASDLADHVIGTGRAATYPASSADEMPVKLKQNWVVKNGANVAMCDTVRNLVRFRQLNLLGNRSEEHTSELQSLMRISYAVFCLKKKKQKTQNANLHTYTEPTIGEHTPNE